MNDKKLNDLIRKGLDERTPDLEALACLRVAAKQFSTDCKPEVDEHLGKLEQERDAARAESAKHKAEVERLKIILGKLLALNEAEQKLKRTRTDVEREAANAIRQKEPARPIDPREWVNAPFANGFPSGFWHDFDVNFKRK